MKIVYFSDKHQINTDQESVLRNQEWVKKMFNGEKGWALIFFFFFGQEVIG